MSSANALTLKDSKVYKTGYYLNEFVVPFRKLIDAGYEPVIANPNGDLPEMDANLNHAMFFGGDDAARASALEFANELEQLKHPKTLASVVQEGILLNRFHDAKKTTGIVCHGPIVLLSALPDPDVFINSLIAGDGKANSLAQKWPYADYRLTVFSTGEEQALEGSGGLGGNVRFYPVNALAEAGARVETVANWHPNVVVDRELITGQQLMSASQFADVLISQLNMQGVPNTAAV